MVGLCCLFLFLMVFRVVGWWLCLVFCVGYWWCFGLFWQVVGLGFGLCWCFRCVVLLVCVGCCLCVVSLLVLWFCRWLCFCCCCALLVCLWWWKFGGCFRWVWFFASGCVGVGFCGLLLVVVVGCCGCVVFFVWSLLFVVFCVFCCVVLWLLWVGCFGCGGLGWFSIVVFVVGGWFGVWLGGCGGGLVRGVFWLFGFGAWYFCGLAGLGVWCFA